MQVSNQQTYRSIFKATSLFGGLQVYQILIGIVRSKFIAMLLGPSGMGIASLYTTATSFIKSLSSMGLASSAVRDVSQAYGTGDQDKINIIITVLRKLVWMTGILGMILVVVGSPILSNSTFGNYEYILPFVVLSVTVLVDQLTVGQNVILQGTRRLKNLAKSSAIGSTIGLLVTIPLYYIWGVDGIVPTLVIISVVSYLLAKFYARQVPFSKQIVSFRETISQGSIMLKMGLAMSVNGFLVSFSAYILRVFIMHQGSISDVGFFTAGFAIVTTYVGMVFSAISTDYYPRLAAVNEDNEKCCSLINQEGEMGSLILGPCLIGCIVFMPLIIRILYTDEFSSASDYVLWASLGMMFKLVGWVVAFVFLAKSAMKLFLINEIFGLSYNLVLSLLGFYFDGLRGLGIAFSLGHLIYAVVVCVITHYSFKYTPSISFLKVYFCELFMIVVSLVVVIMTKGVYAYALGSFLLLFSGVYSIWELNKRMDLIGFIKR